MQGLPLLTPLPESPSTEPVAAPGVAVTKSPATGSPLAAKTDPAPALSPSQVRCFLDCPARWWFKYRLQLPERKNSSLALGLAVHQALEVNFREKLETQEDLETTGVLIVFREAWMEQVPQTDFTPDESQGDLRRLGERLVAKYMDEVAPKVAPAAVELDVQGEISGVAVRGTGGRAGRGRRADRFQNGIPPAFLCFARLRVPVSHLPADQLVAKYMDEVAPKVEPAAVELDVQGEISGVAVRGTGGRAGRGRTADRFQNGIPPAFLCFARLRVPVSHLPADHSRRQRRSAHRQPGEDSDCPDRAAGLHS